MFIIAKLLLTITAADFTSGLVHWLEDAYAHPHMRWFGNIARENLQHHAKPREFLKKNWWQSSWDLFLLGLAAIATALHFHVLSGWFLLYAVLVVNANQIHKWTHSNRQETPAVIRLLQRYNIMQNSRHHALHHRGQRDSHYCVMTSYLNPALEAVNFWKSMEIAIERLTGVKRRNDAQYLAH